MMRSTLKENIRPEPARRQNHPPPYFFPKKQPPAAVRAEPARPDLFDVDIDDRAAVKRVFMDKMEIRCTEEDEIYAELAEPGRNRAQDIKASIQN
jgi:hypothetical protein